MSTITKTIKVDKEYIHVEVFRNKGTSEAEVCRYQIKVEDEGLVIDAVEDDEIVALDAYDHVFMEYQCPECKNSDYPGRHYNNNDMTSGQWVPCESCNENADLASSVPAYPEDVL
jgi:hypothetical protein